MTTTEHVSNRTSPPCIAAGEITKNTSNISKPDPDTFVLCFSWLVAAFWFAVTIGTTNVYAGETEKYHGQILLEGLPSGYHRWGGSCLSSDCSFSLTGSEFIAKNGKKISAIWLQRNTGSRDAKGDIIWRVEDTFEYPSDYQYNFDADCTVSAYPDTTIIAMGGKWHNRKSPQVGGYRSHIKRAWRVDFKTRKFVEISTKGVVCELNEDRD